MERRTFESPMDWEYQNQGPMDPTSPFVQSAQKAQNNNAFGLPRSGNQSIFTRTQSSSPQKPQLPAPAQGLPGSSSALPSSAATPFHRTNTAPPFRNAAFTTPRRPYDMDALSETSAAEDSPALTDMSENYPETPETDNMRGLGRLALNPALSHVVSPVRKRSPGKGEIPRGSTTFPSRDRVRKRRRRHDDKDVSGLHLPYRYHDEWDESEGNASDDSTYQPSDQRTPDAGEPPRRKKGWLSAFLSDIQKHPDAPRVLGYWITFFFNVTMVGLVMWLVWVLVASFRDDFWAARHELRAQVIDEMNKCLEDYRQNKCEPKEQRLPALNMLCEEWAACMNQDVDKHRSLSLGAKNIVEILNDIVETMHWKTLAALFAVLGLFCFSGFSLVKSSPASFAHVPYQPQPSQPVFQPQPQVIYGHIPQTPRTRYRGMIPNDETPDTDASPSEQRALPPPYLQTPSSRRSPSKDERGRSPTKSRSPSKRY